MGLKSFFYIVFFFW